MKVKTKLPIAQLKRTLKKRIDLAVDEALKKEADDLRRQAYASMDYCSAVYHATDIPESSAAHIMSKTPRR